MDNILDMMEQEDKPFKNFKPKSNKVNLWEKDDFEKLKIDLNKMLAPGNTFATYTFGAGSDIPDDIQAKFEEIGKALYGKGYTYRFNSDDKNVVENKLRKLDKARVELFLPWKKFNAEASEKEFNKPVMCHYRISAGIHGKFNNLPPAVRTILASVVNSLIGNECNDPVKFVAVYTPNGAEAYAKGMTFEVIGQLGFILSVAEAANIPVFNIKNEESLKRLIELIKS